MVEGVGLDELVIDLRDGVPGDVVAARAQGERRDGEDAECGQGPGGHAAAVPERRHKDRGKLVLVKS
jgi:hypothetical protein